jgi:hypothetical protein
MPTSSCEGESDTYSRLSLGTYNQSDKDATLLDQMGNVSTLMRDPGL